MLLPSGTGRDFRDLHQPFLDNHPLSSASTASVHEIYLAEQKKHPENSLNLRLHFSPCTNGLLSCWKVCLSPASHLSSYLRNLLSCRHAQGSGCNLTLLRPRTCRCHGNGREATGAGCGLAGHRRGPQPGSSRQRRRRTPLGQMDKNPQPDQQQ